MKTMEEIRAFFAGDRFAAEAGIVIDRVEGDTAVCSVELRESHYNANGVAQGGLIFTLADFAFAVAVNHEECATVTLDSTIHFLRPGNGKRLIATACCVSRSRAVCVYEIGVEDETGARVARVTATGYIRVAAVHRT